jgi:hypothetical protein
MAVVIFKKSASGETLPWAKTIKMFFLTVNRKPAFAGTAFNNMAGPKFKAMKSK